VVVVDRARWGYSVVVNDLRGAAAVREVVVSRMRRRVVEAEIPEAETEAVVDDPRLIVGVGERAEVSVAASEPLGDCVVRGPERDADMVTDEVGYPEWESDMEAVPEFDGDSLAV
jgi:hypothetical protein